MPWCPKCKYEYREGTTVCADCGSALVEDLKDCEEKTVLFTTPNSKTAKELIQLLDFSKLDSHELRITEDDQYELYVAKSDLEDAEEIIKNYQMSKGENEDDVVTEEEQAEKNLHELQAPSNIYVPQADKYNDFKFSGITFLVFTVLGYGLVIMNKLGYISILNSFSTWVMIAVFTLFGVIGASTLIKANSIKKNIGEEEKTTIAIKDWMTVHFSGDFIESCNDTELGEDQNYFVVMEQLMAKLTEAFPDVNTSYLEQLADQFYSDYLEQ